MADIANLAGTVLSTVGGIFISKKAMEEDRKLMEELNRLSLAQQKELAEKQMQVTSEVEKMQQLYMYLAVVKHSDTLSKVSKNRYIGISILGISLLSLTVVIIIASKKNG